MSESNGHHHEGPEHELLSVPVPVGWARTTVGEVGDVRLGRQRSPKNRSSKHPTKYIRAANITWNGLDLSDVLDMEFLPKERDAYRLVPGDVLLSEASGSPAEVGKPVLWNGEIEDCCFQNTVVRFRSRIVNPRFALLAFSHFARNGIFSRASKGVGIHHLSADRFSSLPFLVPPSQEQERIAAKAEELSSDLDAAVAVVKRAKANLKRYRASVYKAAIEGTLTAEWRAKQQCLESATDVLKRTTPPPRPARYKTRSKDVVPGHAALSVGATGATLPAGWAWSPLVDIARMESGHTPSRNHPEWWDGDVCWIGILDAKAHHGGVIHETLQHTNEDGLANSAARLLPAGTVCVSRTAASIGYVVVLGRPMATSQDFVNWVPTEAVTPDWLRLIFSVDREVLIRFGKGSTHKTVYFPEWLSLHIAVPPLKEQRRIVTEVDLRLSQIASAEQQLEVSLIRAKHLRQSILKQAFEGRLVAQDASDEPATELLARTMQQAVAVKVASVSDDAAPAKKSRHQFFRRAAIVAYTVNRLASHKSFGRTQLEKTLHLAQSHVGVDLDFEFERYAAGPFDKAIYKIEGAAKKNGWFTKQDRKNFGVTYHPGPKTESMCKYAEGYLGSKQSAFDRLLDHIATMNTDEAELFATAYAAWNDLLIDGRRADDTTIINEVHGWHESKKRFTPQAIRNRLKWMREQGYKPKGTGKRTTTLISPQKRRLRGGARRTMARK